MSSFQVMLVPHDRVVENPEEIRWMDYREFVRFRREQEAQL